MFNVGGREEEDEMYRLYRLYVKCWYDENMWIFY